MLTPLDVGVLVVGSALTGGMFFQSLRRMPWPVSMDTRALYIGEQAVAWESVLRLAFVRGVNGAYFRVFTDAGELDFRDDQLDRHPETAARRIVELAKLVTTEPEHMPSSLAPGDRWEEWARQSGTDPAVESAGSSATRAPAAGGWRSRSERNPSPVAPDSAGKGVAVGIGALLLLVAKFGKLLGAAFGGGLKLAQFLPTLLSMLTTIWLYAKFWGWPFAAGFVLLILVHELGHAAVMRAKGLRTSPIVFIPFVGALIAVKGQFRDATVEAESAYGGPATGALSSVACLLVFAATGNEFWLHLCYVGCFLNLFNLLPVSPLDGGRIVTGISVWLWVVGLAAALALAIAIGNPLLYVIVLLGAIRAWKEWKRRRDPAAAGSFVLPPGYRVRMAVAYFGLIAFLGYVTLRALELGGHVV